MSELIKTCILRHNAPTPRYTSYPPATVFSETVSGDTVQTWLQNLPAGRTLSLYIHIPFCTQLCYYCGCHTIVANKYERIRPYLEHLKREIDIVSAHTVADLKVTHIHFGGGSPTFLQDSDFADILGHIRSRFIVSPEAAIAIEADPRHLSRDKIQHFAACGVTRLSLGVQDFDDKVLKAVNRPQPYALTAEAVTHARAAGINGINFDIMYGLPLQTLESQIKTLKRVIALKPDRVAYFGYAHVPWMKRHMDVIGQNNLPDATLRYDLFETGRTLLSEAGYHFIGIDHFVRDTDSMYSAWENHTLRRNFQGYTTDQADALIGFGASAISFLPQGYAQNIREVAAYGDCVMQGRLPVARGHALNDMDRARAKIITDIMCYGQAHLRDIAHACHLAEDSFNQDCVQLQPLIRDGLVYCQDGLVRVEHGMPFIARMVARAFDHYTEHQAVTQRHAAAV